MTFDAAALDGEIRGAGHARDQLLALLDALSLLDALNSLAHPPLYFSYPTFVDDGEPRLRTLGLFHPFVSRPVSVDLSWEANDRVLFMTGPNMGGKTTLMRAAALVVYLAHVGMAVPAAAAELSTFDRLFAALTVRDSIQRGESFFLAEVRRIGALTKGLQRGERTFAIVDEAFKGTNVADARAATELLVSGLACCDTGLFIVASHLTEAAEGLDPSLAVRLVQMGTRRDGDRWVFTYQLEPGVSAVRLGMTLLEREGVAPALRGFCAHSRRARSDAVSVETPRSV
jgi:DNA mismatch repair ATPase MutS